MYSGVLAVHSWVRWAVLIAGAIAVIRAVAGAITRRPWTAGDDRAGFWFTMTLDLQVAIGLILYFALSPFTTEALGSFGAAMRTPPLRYWAVEHPFGMIVAIALAHIGRARTRKVDMWHRHRTGAIFFGLALAVVLFSIPWPGLSNGRPWIRW